MVPRVTRQITQWVAFCAGACAMVVVLAAAPCAAGSSAAAPSSIAPTTRHCGTPHRKRSGALRKAGTARVLGATYVLYLDAPARSSAGPRLAAGVAPAGKTRLLVFRDSDYLGAYAFDAAQSPQVKVSGGIVRIVARDQNSRRLHNPSRTASFDLHAGPPPNLWFDGSLVDLER